MFGSINLTIASGEKFARRQSAESLAKSLIHKAIAQYKSGNLEFRDTLNQETSTSAATLTFVDEGAPYSTNNLTNSAGAVGWNGQLVPPKSVHLVSVCEVGGERIAVEMLLNQTSFPWSVASNGTIQGNDMEVFAIESKDEADGGFTDGEKLKSNIVSNSSGASGGNSIELSGNSVITGDAKAVAGISLLDASVVEGKLQANADAVNITLDRRAEDYRPDPSDSIAYDPTSVAPITGRYEASGDTVIGDLKFEDGMLFVDGNVTVTGDISGIGALVATGNITVTGSMNTKADLAALVAGGDINITGVGPNTSSFQGLILAEGSFKAKDTTLVGSALTLDQNGSVELERVRSVAAKDLTKLDLSYAVELKKAIDTNASSADIGVLYEGRFLKLEDTNYSALEQLANQIAIDGTTAQVVIELSPGNYSPTPPPGYREGRALLQATTSWSTYESQVKTSTVVYEDIFQLDFNKFLKTKGGFRPLLQRITSL